MRLFRLQTPLLLGVALVFGLATDTFADDLAEVTAASDSALLSLKKSIAEKDSGLLASLFTSDGAIISAEGYTISGRLKIRMAAKLAMLSGGSGTLSAVRDAIAVIEDAAYETGSYTFRRAGATPRQQTVFRGHYTIVWRMEDKVWKIDRAIGMK